MSVPREYIGDRILHIGGGTGAALPLYQEAVRADWLEANPVIAESLKFQLEEVDEAEKHHVHALCAFDRSMDARPFYVGGNLGELGSTLRATQGLKDAFDAYGRWSRIMVPTTSINDFLTDFDDTLPDTWVVQAGGAEDLVLLGGHEFIGKEPLNTVVCTLYHSPLYQGQGHPDNIISMLNEFDFRLVGMYSTHTTKRVSAVFIR